MALDLLFPHFDQVIRTPEDVQRLNEAILQLAVQGKLVAQDPNDEAASELLRRIQTETKQLELAKGANAVTAFHANGKGDAIHSLPSRWQWVRVGAISDHRLGKMLDKHKNKGEYRPYLRNTNVQWDRIDLSDVHEMRFEPSEFPEYQLKTGDLLICEGGEPGRCAIWTYPEQEMMFQKAIHRVRPYGNIVPRYLMFHLWTDAWSGRLEKFFTGATIKHFTGKALADYPIALPPVAEQQRIVAKVDELFAQTRALEARLRQAQEDVVTVNRAALHRLHIAQDDDQYQASWHILRDHFDMLYDDPRNVAELRQTILNLAVRGKLVPQDPEDEPAEELLRRINGNRSRDLGRKSSSTPPYEAIKSEVSHALPVSWSWAPFIDVADIATDSTDPGLFPDLPHIAPDNIEKFTGRLLAYRTVAEDGLSSVNHHFFPGQILYSKIRSNLSKAVLIDFEGLCSADMYPIRPLIDPRYLHLYILSSVFLSTVTRTDTRVAMPKINQEALNKVPVAVPPFAEQQRIVAKVNQLMRLCDVLEAGLTQVESGRSRLAASVLARIRI